LDYAVIQKRRGAHRSLSHRNIRKIFQSVFDSDLLGLLGRRAKRLAYFRSENLVA
jgi:hypothetical protein